MADLPKERVQRKSVRGRPFEPGNPGRPPGSKNKSTGLIEQLMADEAETLSRKVIEKALSGDPSCLKICIDRLAPRRNGRPIDFELPAIKAPNDIVAAVAAIVTAVNDGRLTAEEAHSLVRVVESYREAVTEHNVLARLEALELQMKEQKS